MGNLVKRAWRTRMGKGGKSNSLQIISLATQPIISLTSVIGQYRSRPKNFFFLFQFCT